MFRNRGKTPNINTGSGNNGPKGYSAPHYSHYWNGRFVIIRYDRSFVAISLIATAIILITAFCAYLFGYEVPFEDPITSVKSNFLTAQLVAIITTIALVILAVCFTKKSKGTLIRYLRIISVVSLLAIIVFWGVKYYLDTQYNEETFTTFYNEYEAENNDENSKRLTYGLSSINISSPEQAYIKESTNAYTNFTIKVMLYIFLQFLLVILILYFSFRLAHIEEKKAKLEKDDKVLFDDVQNVKF